MSAIATARVDLVVNLLRRCLDPVASEGEASNAANKLVIVARREQVDFAALAAANPHAGGTPQPLKAGVVPVWTTGNASKPAEKARDSTNSTTSATQELHHG
jgi:hypothetical protein